MYLGISGCSVTVLYQLYKCPFHFDSFSIVSNMFFSIVISFSKSIYPKSYADTMLNRPNPIFVDDVLFTIFCVLSS